MKHVQKILVAIYATILGVLLFTPSAVAADSQASLEEALQAKETVVTVPAFPTVTPYTASGTTWVPGGALASKPPQGIKGKINMGIVEILLIILSLLCVVVVPGLLIAIIYMLRGDRKYDNGGLGEKGPRRHCARIE